MKTIKLSRGLSTVVDDEDFDALSRYRWCAVQKKKTFYAQRSTVDGWVLMHRLISSAEDGYLVDHKDGDGLNNRRENLRSCNGRQNAQNQTRPKRASKTSQFKGVYQERRFGRWVARIRAGAVGPSGASAKLSLGTFGTEEEAARAYDSAASRYFGEFAALNFPTKDTRS